MCSALSASGLLLVAAGGVGVDVDGTSNGGDHLVEAEHVAILWRCPAKAGASVIQKALGGFESALAVKEDETGSTAGLALDGFCCRHAKLALGRGRTRPSLGQAPKDSTAETGHLARVDGKMSSPRKYGWIFHERVVDRIYKVVQRYISACPRCCAK